MNQDGNVSLRPKSNDPGWKYNMWAFKDNKIAVRCNYCGFVSKGGICRAKQHQIGGYRNVSKCEKVPDDVRAELMEYVERQKAKKNNDGLHELTMDYEDGGYGDDEPDEDGDVDYQSNFMIYTAEWWKLYGKGTPNLQQFAIKVLSLTCNASGCERNWSTFEHIHSKKRNRLEHIKLQELVYVKYNNMLRNRRDTTVAYDPISLEDIDDSNEWLTGIMEDDRVHNDDDLTWTTVGEASGAGEPLRRTRSNPSPSRPSSSRPTSFVSLIDEDTEEEEDDI